MNECTRSATAQALHLDNTPTAEHRNNIEQTVKQLLDPLREGWAVRCANNPGWGTPALNISSGYRGFRLNAAVGGSQTSAHCVGYAFDLVPKNGRLADFKAFCREFVKGRAFDQLISEDENTTGVPQWIHLGYKNQQGKQRQLLLSMSGGKYANMTT